MRKWHWGIGASSWARKLTAALASLTLIAAGTALSGVDASAAQVEDPLHTQQHDDAGAPTEESLPEIKAVTEARALTAAVVGGSVEEEKGGEHTETSAAPSPAPSVPETPKLESTEATPTASEPPTPPAIESLPEVAPLLNVPQMGAGEIASHPAPRPVLLAQNQPQSTGSFQVKLSSVGAPLPENRASTVYWTCGEESGAVSAATDGVPVPAGRDFADGTSCTLSVFNFWPFGKDGYAVVVPSKTFVIEAGKSPVYEIVATYHSETGSLTIRKKVEGGPTEARTHRFVFRVDCGQGKELVQLSPAKGIHQHRLYPVGTECTVYEETPSAQFDGYALIPPPQQKVTIELNKSPVLDFVNDYSKPGGTFEVKKVVQGGPGNVTDKEYEFFWTCGELKGRVTAKGDGVPVRIKQLFPVGTQCEIAESDHIRPIGGYTLEKPAPQQIVIAAGSSPVLEFVNTYKSTQPEKRTFKVKKVVQGGPPEAVNKEYEFQWVCGNERGTVMAKGDGVPVRVDKDFPAGTRCLIQENEQKAEIDGYALEPPRGAGVELEDGETPVVEFVNKYADEAGSFEVKKRVEGGPSDVDTKEFVFVWFCVDEYGSEKGGGSLTAKGDGVPVSIGKLLPAGWRCTVGEVFDSAIIPGEALIVPPPQTVVIKNGTTPVLEFTNTYSDRNGSFQVSKTVVGGPADAATQEYGFYWKCGTLEGILGAKGDGVPVSPELVFSPGTECLVMEDLSGAAIDGWALQAPAWQKVRISAGKKPVLHFTNTYTKQFGSFEVKKTVSGGPAAASDKEYDFHWKCGELEDEMSVTGDGVPTPVGVNIPAGTECTVTEALDYQDIDGFVSIAPPPQTVTIEAGKTSVLEFENTFSDKFGELHIKKTVVGGPPTAKTVPFVFDVKCGNASAVLLATAEDTKYSLDPVVPAGTQCTVTERKGYASMPGYVLTPPPAQQVTITENETVEVEFVNTYSEAGSFEVKKTVEGGPASATTKSYEFNWKCGNREGTLIAKGDGVTVPLGESLPTGTVCTISENTAQAKIDGYTLAPPAEQTVTIVSDEDIEVSFLNVYKAEKPAGASGTDGKVVKGGKLAHTGSDAFMVSSVAAALLGGALLVGVLRRKRR